MKIFFYLIGLISLLGCSTAPQAISYGKDACTFCKMNIVDQQHAAEIVSKKGKVFKYDAIECMLKDNDNNSTDNVAKYLVMDYKKPNQFLDAAEASFVVCEAIPSPMGANLSAFENKESAEKEVAGLEYKLYSWSEILKEF